MKLPSEYLQQGWARKAWARTAKGYAVAPNHPKAICWCFEGAIRASYTSIATISDWSNKSHFVDKFLLKAFEIIYSKGWEGLLISDWNDSRRSQKVVVKLAQEVERALGLS